MKILVDYNSHTRYEDALFSDGIWYFNVFNLVYHRVMHPSTGWMIYTGPSK